MSSFECNDATSMMSKMVELMIGSAPAVAAQVEASAVALDPSTAEQSGATVAVASSTEEASSLFCTDEEFEFLLAACVDTELMNSSVPTDVAAAAPTDAAVDEDDDEEDDDAVTQVQEKKGKKKNRKNKKKKKPTTTAPTAAPAATAERSLTIPPAIQQLLTARNKVHHDQLLALFRTLATIPIDGDPLPNSLWFFVGKILTKPLEMVGECKGIYWFDVQDVDGMQAKCLFDTTIGRHRFVSLSGLTVGKTIFIPDAVKGGDNNLVIYSENMEDCIHVFPIHLEDVRRIKWSAVPTDVHCELCSEFIKQDFALCDECLRVLYCSAKCKQDDWFRHNRMCAGKLSLCAPSNSSSFLTSSSLQ